MELADLKGILNLNLPEQYVPWAPTPHQSAFLLVPSREALYGGSAGGGKSIALLMGALQYVDQSGYNALIIRKTFKDLNQPEALIDISKEWLTKTDAKWNQSDHAWRFPSGAILQFGHMESENDKYQYQGAAYHYVGFDELTQFTEGQYTYLLSRVRRRANDETTFPLRVRGAANPGGVGHEWVKRRFIELPEDEYVTEQEQAKFDARIFIPSGLKDNPHLDQVSYMEMLEELDPVTRAQLLHGDWDIAGEGNMFKKEWFDNRMLSELPQGVNLIRRLRYWDLASTDEEKVIKEKGDADYTASVLQALGDDGNIYVLEVSQDRMSPASVEKLIKTKADRDGRIGTAIWMEQEPGSSGVQVVHHFMKAMLGYNFRGDKPTGSKIERARPASAACENGLVYIIRGAKTKAFINELHAFPMGAHDDMVDAFTGGFNKIADSAMIGRSKLLPASQKKKSIWA